MNFNDIFKSGFLENVSSIGVLDMMLTIVLSFGIGLFIFLIYKKTFRGVMYSAGFGTTLVALTMITSIVVLAVTSNVVLSLGMVGALSIVRFRTAIKDPIDLMFLFWSISVGIICGAGLAQVAVILSVVLTLGILILDQMPVAKAPMILVVNAEDFHIEEAVCNAVGEFVKHYNVKSRNMTRNTLDLVIELRTERGREVVQKVMDVDGVTSVSLLSHDGEVTF